MGQESKQTSFNLQIWVLTLNSHLPLFLIRAFDYYCVASVHISLFFSGICADTLIKGLHERNITFTFLD